jgi:CheY-like chemotaxis protein
MLLTILAYYGYSTYGCRTSQEALQQIRANPPQLIIVDFHLERPNSGIYLLEQLQRDQLIAIIPIILCSADIPLLAQHQERMPIYPCAVVSKPFMTDVLINAVRQCLGPSC